MIGRKELLEDLMQISDINELRLIRSAISDRIKEVGSRIKYQLLKDDKVIVTSKKGVESGTIEKVNRTKAVVNINGTSWNVPFSMITKS
jgi:exopolysaccharide biosynthesis protein|tara:strand:- start:12 stop:278 length:267 start_codon:yes stop_codon:yes gene_type:complete